MTDIYTKIAQQVFKTMRPTPGMVAAVKAATFCYRYGRSKQWSIARRISEKLK